MWIIDRIEGEFALCETENKTVVSIPLSALPKGIKEGDVLSIGINRLETENRIKRINDLADSLFK